MNRRKRELPSQQSSASRSMGLENGRGKSLGGPCLALMRPRPSVAYDVWRLAEEGKMELLSSRSDL